jgi:hypothetical protein
MPDSEWIIFLPLVGAILGAVVGAVGGAWANSRYRDREAKQAEKRERDSLLFLLDAEIRSNSIYLTTVDLGPPAAVIKNLRINVWESTQVRLAHLLTPRNMKDLVLYYELLKVNQASRIAVVKYPDDLSESDRESIEELIQRGGALLRMIQDYIKDPDYADILDSIEGRMATK